MLLVAYCLEEEELYNSRGQEKRVRKRYPKGGAGVAKADRIQREAASATCRSLFKMCLILRVPRRHGNLHGARSKWNSVLKRRGSCIANTWIYCNG